MPQRPKRASESSSKSSTEATLPPFLAVARVTKPHGTRGELVLASLSGETEHLLRLTSFTLRSSGSESRSDRVVEVEAIRRAHNRVLVKLRGIDTPETAAALRGMEVWVSREKAAPLGESEYYVADLVDCRVFLRERDAEAVPVGYVAGVIEGPTDDFLEVNLEEGGAVLVPLRNVYVGDVDLSVKRIEILDPEILQ